MGILILGNSGYTEQDERDGLEQSTGVGLGIGSTDTKWRSRQEPLSCRFGASEETGNWKLVCSGCGRKLAGACDSYQREARDLPCFVFRTVEIATFSQLPGRRFLELAAPAALRQIKFWTIPGSDILGRNGFATGFRRVCFRSCGGLIAASGRD